MRNHDWIRLPSGKFVNLDRIAFVSPCGGYLYTLSAESGDIDLSSDRDDAAAVEQALISRAQPMKKVGTR